MKKLIGNWLVGVAVAVAAGSAMAQTVPPGLIDNLRIVGIQKWEVVHTNVGYVMNYPANTGIDVLAYAHSQCGSDPNASCYLIKMTVNMENTGDARVLLKDPQFTVRIMQHPADAEILGNLPVKQRGDAEKPGTEGIPVFKGTNAPMEEATTELGMARLVADHNRPNSWKPIAEIPCPEGTAKSKESQHQFEIVVRGANDMERASQIFRAFNAMNNQSQKWSLTLDGKANVGWRSRGKSESSTMVFAHDPIDIVIESRPTLPDQIAFPK